MMTFLCILGPASLPQVPRSRGVGVFCEFVKCTTIPGVESGLNSRVNIFGACDESEALQDNLLKNYHPLNAPFPSSYAIKIY